MMVMKGTWVEEVLSLSLSKMEERKVRRANKVQLGYSADVRHHHADKGKEGESSRTDIRTFSTWSDGGKPAAEYGHHPGVLVHHGDGLSHVSHYG
jgi:hypothetical protein